jgi:AraC-like DNA-binding protein
MVLIFPPEVLECAFDRHAHGGPVGARLHLGARSLASALRRGTTDQLEAEELALVLLGQVADNLGREHTYRPAGSHQRDRVETVRALLAVEPHRRWRLEELARAVHCSPFHLARQFRALMGSSISTSLLRLRLAIALQRLAEGEANLARLADDLGFANHSHFSARSARYSASPRDPHDPRSPLGGWPRCARS